VETPAPAGRPGLEIRSFGVVFRLERRLHKIDRWRLPLPYGLPVVGLAYALAALLALLVLAQLPLLGDALALLPAPVRYVLLPGALGLALARGRWDGRPAHHALAAWARFRLGPQQLSAFRPCPAPGQVLRIKEPITLVADATDSRLRPARIHGAGSLVLLLPARATVRGARLSLTAAGGEPLRRPRRIRLGPGQRIRIR
jgi:hypothetical protein